MADDSDKGPEDLLSPFETARSLNLSESSLAKMRCLGGGPVYIKIGRTVRYEPEVVREYKLAHRVRHTSDAARLPPRMTAATIVDGQTTIQQKASTEPKRKPSSRPRKARKDAE